jgi:hypothetical protein
MSKPANLYLVVCRCKMPNPKIADYLNAHPNAPLAASTWLIQSFRTPDILEQELRALAMPDDAVFIQRVSNEAKSFGFEAESAIVLKGLCSKASNV